MKIKIISIGMTMLFSFSMVGCNSKKPDIKKEPVKIEKIVLWTDTSSINALQNIAKEYMKINKGINVAVESIETASLEKNVDAALASEIHSPDIVTVRDDQVTSLALKFPKAFYDLSNEFSPLKDKFIPYKQSIDILEGRVTAVPLSVAPLAILYRKDIFANAGIVPDEIKTWNDYILAGEKVLEKSNGKTKLLVFNPQNTNLFRELLNQLGGSYFNKDYELTVDSDTATRVMELIRILKEKQVFLQLDKDEEIYNSLKSEKIAAFLADPQTAVQLEQKWPESKGKWGIMRLPAFEPGGNRAAVCGGVNALVMKNTENRQSAVDFIRYAVSNKKTMLANLLQYGVFPAYYPFYDDIAEQKTDFYKEEEIWKTFISSSMNSYEVYYTPSYDEINAKTEKVQSDILTSKIPVKGAMNALQMELKAEFGDDAKGKP